MPDHGLLENKEVEGKSMYVFEERNIVRSWPFIVNLLLLQDTCGGVEKGNKQGFIAQFLQTFFSILFSASQFFMYCKRLLGCI